MSTASLYILGKLDDEFTHNLSSYIANELPHPQEAVALGFLI